MSVLFQLPKQVVVTSAGRPFPGAKANFYLTGTTTATNVYQDADLTTPHANPVVADSAGVFPAIYLDPDVEYKLTLTQSNDTLIYTVDPVSDSLSAENIGRILYPRTDAEISAGVTPVDYRYPELDVRRYGTNTTPGVTDLRTAIQNALNVAEQRGGGVVLLPPETCAISGALSQASNVILEGHGEDVTRLFLLANSDSDMVVSKDFATYTLQDHTEPSVDGIPHRFGLRRLCVDGNGTNQTTTTTYAVKYCGVAFILDEVTIYRPKGGGLYTEAGAEVSNELTDIDMLDATIGKIRIKRAGENGWTMRGPHDAKAAEVFISEAGFNESGTASGFVTEFSTNQYSGTCDVGFMHVYSTRGPGVKLNVPVRFGQLISESNWEENLHLADSGARGSQFAETYLFNGMAGTDPSTGNAHTAGDHPNLLVEAPDCQFGILRIRDQNDAGGVKVDATNLAINDLDLNGDPNSTGGGTVVGLDVDANHTRIRGHVRGYNGSGGTGLRTGNSAGLLGTNLDLLITDCDTLWNNVAAGVLGTIKLRGTFTNSTQTGFTGVQPSTTWSESWDVAFRDSSSNYFKSHNKLAVSTTVDLTTTNEQTWTINHEMLTTPRPEDVKMWLNMGVTAEQDFVIAYMGPSTISATQITFEFKLSSASGTGGADARLYAEVNLT